MVNLKKYRINILETTGFKNAQVTAGGISLDEVNTDTLESKIIKGLEIPIPPIDIQNKIVHILEKFDELCNDITNGLPAEIEARQKQYEYYRDKLLTFKEKK